MPLYRINLFAVLRPVVLWIFIAVFFGLCMSPYVAAQPGLPPDDLKKIEDIINTASDKSTAEKIKALENTIEIIRNNSDGDNDLLTTAIILEIEADRMGLYTDEFKKLAQRIVDTTNPDVKRLALRELRLSLLTATTNMMQLMAKDGIDEKDAARLIKLAKSASQLVDDLADVSDFSERGSFDGAKSKISKFLTAANGIASLRAGTADRDANKLMSGFRDTIGSISFKAKSLGVKVVNPIKAIEYPAAVTAAQLQVVNQGFEDVNDSLQLVTELMENDNPETRRRLLASINKVENTLSRENFGNKMLDALIDRTAERVPFLRTVRAWGFGGKATGERYENDFKSGAGSEWSNTKSDITPVGSRKFLGQFGNESVTLSLTKLKAGMITLEFDLFLINSWDGNKTGYGPDYFTVSVGNEKVLIKTTFSNLDENDWKQSYPAKAGLGNNPAYTGARERDSLGYKYYGDSVYRLKLTFRHEIGSVKIKFSAQGLQDLADESWGIANVVVDGAS